MIKPLQRPALRANFLATLAIGLPGVLFAQDTYYVLIANDDDAREVLLSVHNPTDRNQSFDALAIASGTNGVERPGSPTTMSVPAGHTVQYGNLAGNEPSMVELVAHGELTFQAYTMPTDSRGRRVGPREQVPIVDSRNMVPADTWAFVSGLRRDSRDRSDYAILNLSRSSRSCEHRVRGRDGRWALESRVLNHLPLSLTYVTDVLQVVGIDLGDQYTISTNCDGNFYVAALIAADGADRLSILEPSLIGASELRPPGQSDPPQPNPGNPPPTSCPQGWTCIGLDRTSHAVKESNLQYVFRTGLDAGNYDAVALRFNLRTTAINPVGAQVFWLGINRHTNLIGFVVQRRNELFLRHGIGIRHSDKAKLVLPRTMKPNQDYAFDYSYTAGGRVSLCVTDSQGARFCSHDTANVDSLSLSPSDRLILVTGSDGKEEIEPPQWGWTYNNIELMVRRN
jgi:hypothetical protein